MTARRKIAELLRRIARAIDDTPRPSRAELDARFAAIMAIPRRVNRYAPLTHSNRQGGKSILDNPLVLRAASDMERRSPGTYAENADMVAAIAGYRSGLVS